MRRDARVDFGHLLNVSTAYYERDACHLVRIISGAVAYLHEQGIVHRGEVTAQQPLAPVTDSCTDLKPENLLFRGPEEDADLMIADFGLSRV